MKSLFAVLVLLSFTAHALQTRKITASAGMPIPTSYSATDAQSLVWDTPNSESHLLINNTSSSAVACYVKTDDSTVAPNPALDVISEEIPVPATTAYMFDGLKTSERVYCRSDSGSAITSGTLILARW